jgi:RimJ/RimL family protein N-acetyltransferase
MLNVFGADASDLQWMYRLLINASNKGHFKVDNTKEGREWAKHNLHSIVFNQRRLDENLQAQAMVFESEPGKVGYVVMSEVEEGYGNEIYIFIVDKAFRGNGYGKAMLEEVIARWHPDSTIYARCHPASTVMADMLRKYHFTCEAKNEQVEVYRLDKQHPLAAF